MSFAVQFKAPAAFRSEALASCVTPSIVPSGARRASLYIHCPSLLNGTSARNDGFPPGARPSLGATDELSLHATNAPRAPTSMQALKKFRFIISVPPYDR